MKQISSLAILFLMVLLCACGSRKSPTGGPEDTEKPAVLTTLPAQFAQIDEGGIEINFSKTLDKTSVAQAVYIYPPVANKRFSVDKSTLQIKFDEELQPDTNYFVTLTTRLKDIRGNALAENQTLVFAHGDFNDLRLAGEIAYEESADRGSSVQLSLLSSDSLLVLQRSFSGSTYSLDALNPSAYLLRAYIDKDLNGRYDASREPWYEGKIDLFGNSTLNLALAYADTTLPRIVQAQSVSPREIVLTFSEPVEEYDSVKITRLDNQAELPIAISQLRDTKLTLLTGAQDAFAYNVEMRGLKDRKGNLQTISKADLRSTPNADTSPPQVLSSEPRNGTSVANLRPVLELRFSEIVPRAQLTAVLRSPESSIEYALEILSSDSDVYRFQPQQDLRNYRSYVLEVRATDINGNKMPSPFQLNFLPLLRSDL